MTHPKRMIVTVMAGVSALVALASSVALRDQSLARLQQAGVIRIGYAVEAPYIFLKPGGEVTGAEMEVASAIAARLGIQRIAWRLIEFNELIPQLQDGQIDAIAAGMFITPERAAHVSFSEPTFHVGQGLLVADGNPKELHSYAQAAATPEVRIAVISGAVEEEMLLQLGMSDSRLVHVPDVRTGQTAVENGLADGLALSSLTIRWATQQDLTGRTEMAQPFEQADLPQYRYFGYGGVVFRQEDRRLHSAWNAALENFIGNPEHLELISPFGFTSQELPGTVTMQEIISQ
jgi:polar amino acid transport system substrate-binding protein